MLRLIRHEHLDVADLAKRYNRPVGVIVNYLRERGFDINGKKLPKAPVEQPPARPLVHSAGGSAHYVAATEYDAAHVPLRPVRYRNARPKPEGLDWSAISPDTKCVCQMQDHAPTCPAWVAGDTIRRRMRKAVGGVVRTRIAGRGSSTGRMGPPPKLTAEQGIEIRRRYEAGATAKGLAGEYGVADVTISNAIRRAGGTTRGRRTYSKHQQTQAFEEAS